ncbi:MAG: phosphoribosylamine--glycine ligase [Thermoplasmataceae archaeon]
MGSGGREDAISGKLVSEGSILYSVMGHENPSIRTKAREYRIIQETDWQSVLKYALSIQPDLVFIGPDPVLATPLVDKLEANSIMTASPSSKAARIETDKTYMRDLMNRYSIEGNVGNWSFDSSIALEKWALKYDYEFVVKPRGLTGGKGVRVMGEHFRTRDEGIKYANNLIRRDGSVLIEERILGEEFSLQAFCDGKTMLPMPLAQDYKRAFEGDIGPNTGGMGAITDRNHLLPFIPGTARDKALGILRDVVDRMRAESTPFKGILYGQFMFSKSGTRLIEINARFADPEGINILTIMNDSLEDKLFRISNGNLNVRSSFLNKATVLRYLVPKGYGTKPEPGTIHINPVERDDVRIYYASVTGSLTDVNLSASRALAIVGISDTIPGAATKIDDYMVNLSGDFYMRKDIGTEDMLSKKIMLSS